MESKDKPLLSICIPIHNRLVYLDRMLNRFLEDKRLFEKDIHLFISDNCSEEDLASCCNKYKELGLNLEYNRNNKNIGPDGNFLKCFSAAKGNYTWLLGSDDIPVQGCVGKLLDRLRGTDYGLVYIDSNGKDNEEVEYINPNLILKRISYYITFMSANIINTKSIGSINLEQYRNTNLIQVPQFISASLYCKKNLYLNWHERFEPDTDGANNGGYNFHRVFIENLFKIINGFVSDKYISPKTLSFIKKDIFKRFIVVFNHKIFMGSARANFNTDESVKILWKYYGFNLYAYFYTLKYELKILIKTIVYLKGIAGIKAFSIYQKYLSN